MKTAAAVKADITILPKNGELLLSYWRRIGGQFDGGFLEAARTAAENNGFHMERARLFTARQLTIAEAIKAAEL